jgi:hypothetical protein
MLSFSPQRERVPDVAGDLDIGFCELLAPAFDHPVRPHIVFERVGAQEVVIRRQQPDGDAAA